MGELVTFKLTGAATDGEALVVEFDTPPGGGPPGLHVHPPQEIFSVLAGEYEMSGVGPDGPFTVRATPGTLVHMPKGAPHNYRNVGATRGRLLPIFTAPDMEGFFRELAVATAEFTAAPASVGPADMGKVLERTGPVLRKYGLEFLGPASS